MSAKILYVPIGVGTYHMETADAVFSASVRRLRTLGGEIAVCPDAPLLTKEDARAFVQAQGEGASLILLQNLTFANAAYTREILGAAPGVPVVLWTVREPAADGGRLRLNGLTGAFAAGHTLYMQAPAALADSFLGAPEEPQVQKHLEAVFGAVRLRDALTRLRLGLVGEPPEGFAFGRGDDSALRRVFGVETVGIPAETLMERAREISPARAQLALDEAQRTLCGLGQIPEENIQGFARLLAAYQDWTAEAGVTALASRCWPDFFTKYGTPVCAVLSLLNDEGVWSACEGDRIGALTMAAAGQLSGRPCFFGDPVAVTPEDGTITFWHCGMAPCSLAREEEGAAVGVHPNRKIGPTMEFGCRPAEKVTLLRIGETPDGGFRLFLARGSVADAPRQYLGTSVVVHAYTPAEQMVSRAVEDGWEPHFVVAYGDIADALTVWARMTGIDVWDYDIRKR